MEGLIFMDKMLSPIDFKCIIIHPSRLFRCELLSRGDIGDVCLLLIVIRLDGSQLVVVRAPQTKKNMKLKSSVYFLYVSLRRR